MNTETDRQTLTGGWVSERVRGVEGCPGGAMALGAVGGQASLRALGGVGAGIAAEGAVPGDSGGHLFSGVVPAATFTVPFYNKSHTTTL